jgi:hypothetical protein
MEQDTLLGPGRLNATDEVVIYTKNVVKKSCWCFFFLVILIFICVLPAVLQAKPLASFFLSPNVDNYNSYLKLFNNESICQVNIAPLLHPPPHGVVLLVGLVDINEIQDYLEARTRVRIVNSQCKLNRVYSCLTEIYFNHGLAVHMDTVEELDQYQGFKPSRVIYLQGNPFSEVVKLDNHRLHRAGNNDGDRFIWEYFSEWTRQAKKYPPGKVIQYQNVTVGLLERLYGELTLQRTDITKINCNKGYKPVLHQNNLDLSPGKKAMWCKEFGSLWNTTAFGPCSA